MLTTITEQSSMRQISHGAFVDYPSGLQAGDLLVMKVYRTNTFVSAPFPTTPNWTEIYNVNSSSHADGLRYYLADGTESGPVQIGSTPSSTRQALSVFRGNVPITGVNVQDVQGSTLDTGDPAPKTILSGAGLAPLIVLGGYGSSNGTVVDPRSMSPAKDGEHGVDNNWVAWKIFNSAPSDVTIDMEDEGTNMLGGCYLELS